MGRAPIAEIVSSAKKGATSINRFIQKEALRQDRVIQAKVTEQIPNKGIPIQKSNFDSSNVNKDAFFEESLRCMTCGGKAEISHPDDCMTCYCCELNCPTDAIYVHPIREELPASFNY